MTRSAQEPFLLFPSVNFGSSGTLGRYEVKMSINPMQKRRSPVERSFHSSQSPAAVRSGDPSAAVTYHGCLPLGVSCHS